MATTNRAKINTLTPRVSLLAAIFALLWSSFAAAQQSGPASGTTSELTRVVQSQATALLERHLRPEEFQVFAKVTPADSAQPVPYLPETLVPVAGVKASPGSLGILTKSIEIEVILADRYDAEARAKLKNIVSRALELDESRGDKVTFSSLGLKLDRPDSDVARELAKSEAEARDFKARLEALNRERDDAKREASDAKRDLTVLKTELDRVGRDKPANPADKASTSAAPSQASRGFWGEYAALIVAGIIALLAIFASTTALRGAARNLSEAVQSIGSGLPILGEKLSESLAQKAPLALPPADYERGDRGVPAPQTLSNNSSGATLPMEAVSRRVIELHEELSAAVNEGNEGLVLEYLSQMLEDESAVGRAVATMELMGSLKANHLYNRLAVSHQQKVFTFLKVGRHSRPKGEVMLEAGEALKTKLFGASFASRAKLTDAVAQKLLLLSIDDQVAVSRGLDGESLARLFLYLEPPRIGAILSKLREKDPKRFDRAAPLVVKAPEVEVAANLDHEIMSAIEAQLERATADVHAPYLTYYKTIVESVEDDVAESLAEHFASANPRVERFLRESIVTFGTFFKLHGDIQEEIVSGLNNKDLAALVSPLKPELKTAIYAHIEERRRELVEEEADRLATRGTRQITTLHRAAKRQVVNRIVQIKGAGPLSDLLARQVEGLPAASNQTGSKAA